MIAEQHEQELPPESERETLPPLAPDACPQQELRSALASAQDSIGSLLLDNANQANHLSELSRALLRIGRAAERIVILSPKDVSDEQSPASS